MYVGEYTPPTPSTATCRPPDTGVQSAVLAAMTSEIFFLFLGRRWRTTRISQMYSRIEHSRRQFFATATLKSSDPGGNGAVIGGSFNEVL